MENNFGFDSIFTDEDYCDPFDTPESYEASHCFLVDEERPDPEAFILAVAAYLCYNEAPGETDSILFCDISPLIHPDSSIADYAIHCARRYLKSKAVPSTDDNDIRKTIYHDITKVLEDILCSYSGSECNFYAVFPDKTLLATIEDVLDCCTPEIRYNNDSFFAFAVCIYTILRSHTTKSEATSIMYRKLNLDEAGGGCRYDAILDAVLLVDGCLNEGFARMFSPITVAWHILIGISRYFDHISDPDYDNDSRDDYDDDNDDNYTGFQDLSEVGFSPEIYADDPSGGEDEDDDEYENDDSESVDIVKLSNSVFDILDKDRNDEDDDDDEYEDDEIDYSELEALFDDEYDED